MKDSAGSAEDSRVNAEVLPGAVRVHVGKILASKEFIHSDSLRRFLSYTVEKAMEGEPGCLKESVLGTTLFGRGDAFDPRLDPIVRVQAGKLRTRLQQYYEGEGRSDALVIEFPKGGYVPVFHARENGAAAPAIDPRVGGHRADRSGGCQRLSDLAEMDFLAGSTGIHASYVCN